MSILLFYRVHMILLLVYTSVLFSYNVAIFTFWAWHFHIIQKKHLNSPHFPCRCGTAYNMASKSTWIENIEDSVQKSSQCFITRISRAFPNFQNIIEIIALLKCSAGILSITVRSVWYQRVEDSCFRDESIRQFFVCWDNRSYTAM